MLPSILRLDAPAMRAIRAPVLAGDDLAVARDGGFLWLAQQTIAQTPARGGRTRIGFVYRGDGEELSLTLGLFRADIAEAIAQGCRRMSLRAVDRSWRPTLSRLGRIPHADAAREGAVTRLDGPVVVAARRAVHPSYLLDRLMMRQRALALAAIEDMLAPQPLTRRSA